MHLLSNMTYSNDTFSWTNVHDLALIYLALTHGADAELDPSEVTVMSQKLGDWVPPSSKNKISDILNQVMLVYLGESRTQMLDTSVASLREAMPKGQRIAILNDLADMASADGTIVPGEVGFIQRLAAQWEVDREMN